MSSLIRRVKRQSRARSFIAKSLSTSSRNVGTGSSLQDKIFPEEAQEARVQALQRFNLAMRYPNDPLTASVDSKLETAISQSDPELYPDSFTEIRKDLNLIKSQKEDTIKQNDLADES